MELSHESGLVKISTLNVSETYHFQVLIPGWLQKNSKTQFFYLRYSLATQASRKNWFYLYLHLPLKSVLISDYKVTMDPQSLKQSGKTKDWV